MLELGMAGSMRTRFYVCKWATVTANWHTISGAKWRVDEIGWSGVFFLCMNVNVWSSEKRTLRRATALLNIILVAADAGAREKIRTLVPLLEPKSAPGYCNIFPSIPTKANFWLTAIGRQRRIIIILIQKNNHKAYMQAHVRYTCWRILDTFVIVVVLHISWMPLSWF